MSVRMTLVVVPLILVAWIVAVLAARTGGRTAPARALVQPAAETSALATSPRLTPTAPPYAHLSLTFGPIGVSVHRMGDHVSVRTARHYRSPRVITEVVEVMRDAEAVARLDDDEFHEGLAYAHDIALCGDLDGDGCSEFAVGEPRPRDSQVHVHSGATGELLRVLRPADGEPWFGASLTNVGDWNGDGVSDLAVGCWWTWTRVRGRVKVFSGSDGALLRTYEGDPTRRSFGSRILCLGDVDGDGHDDLLVRSRTQGAKEYDGRAVFEVVSGRDGRRLRFFLGPYDHSSRGEVHSAGDIDGDGLPEVALSYPWVNFGSGRVEILSPPSGRLVVLHDGLTAGGGVGEAVCELGDLDGDGLGELAISHRSDTCLDLQVHPGAGGAPLLEFPGDGSDHRSMARLGDVDRDGTTDFVVATHEGFSWHLDVVSGSSGKVLHAREGKQGPLIKPNLVRHVIAGEDVDGDGIPDYAVRAHATTTVGVDCQGIYVFSGRDSSLLHAKTLAEH